MSGIIITFHFVPLPQVLETIADGSSFLTAFYIQGHRFTYQNTSLLLYRVFVPPSPSSQDALKNIFGEEEELGQLLDASGGYMLQATIRVQDGSKVELVNRGVSELQKLKETLKGVVELEPPERLALDTRVSAFSAR